MNTRAKDTEMLLSLKTTIKLNNDEANVVGHMNYAAFKLWNVCNYERHNYKESDGGEYPGWYVQKKSHKNDLWYKQLPSQTAQETLNILNQAWKSYFALLKSGGIKNPKPPKYKNSGIAITYMQKGLVHGKTSGTVRLTLSKGLKAFMSSAYDIHLTYIYLKNPVFKMMDIIKQIKIYPPEDGVCEIIIVYKVPDATALPDNGRYLSIDQGVHNLMTCYDSACGRTFVAGRRYLSISRWYTEEIARVQSQWAATQSKSGVKYPKQSKHVKRLYSDKNNALNDYLHKVTRHIVNYCIANDIHTVVIGDLTGIREDNNLDNDAANQNFHALPYKKVRDMLLYKLAREGITLVVQKECYSSQTSPLQPVVGKDYATPEKRVTRGMYVDGCNSWNADAVGAYNILRLYLQESAKSAVLSEIQPTVIEKVAV